MDGTTRSKAGFTRLLKERYRKVQEERTAIKCLYCWKTARPGMGLECSACGGHYCTPEHQKALYPLH